jgi:predicted enzyme related to lactoylglutathione lyase
MPVFQHATPTRGLCFAVEVPDVKSLYADITARGFDVLGKLEAFPSGEIAFSMVDPAGVVLNIVEHRGGPQDEVVEL